jgi:tRNA threonylcarbamoyladenosine biosynthesis protein TsaB
VPSPGLESQPPRAKRFAGARRVLYYRDVLILAIDTCDVRGSVCLLDESGLVSSKAHVGSEDYSTWLLPAVREVLEGASRRFSEVTLYAAAAGPGSFTGIRVGLTTVKAWNEVFGVPIVAVSRLEALAVQARGPHEVAPRFVAACYDAQRGEVYAALYRRDGQQYQRIGDEAVVTPGALLEWVEREAVEDAVAWVCIDRGALEGAPGWKDRDRRGELIELVEPAMAPAIARMAKRLATEGKLTDALGLDANYLRRPHAEVAWKGYGKPSL